MQENVFRVSLVMVKNWLFTRCLMVVDQLSVYTDHSYCK